MRSSCRPSNGVLCWLAVATATVSCNALFGVDELVYQASGGGGTDTGGTAGTSTTSSGTGGSGGTGGTTSSGTGGAGGSGGSLPPPTGTPLWSVAFLGDDNDVGLAVAVDDSGDVIVAGEFRANLTVGSNVFVSDGGSDVFAAKLAGTSGAVLWAQHWGGPGNDSIGDVAVDGQGNVAVVGSFRDEITIGSQVHTTAVLYPSIFLATVSGTTGTPQASHSYGSWSGMQYGHDVAFDANGALVIAGTFNGSVNFGGGDLASAGANDIFVAKLGANLALLWAHGYGAAGGQHASAVAVSGQGDIWLGGEFDAPFSIGQHNLPLDEGIDLFLVKLAGATGSSTWHQAVGGADRQQVLNLAVDPTGQVLVAGNAEGTVDFGGGPLVTSSVTTDDLFLVKRTATGAHVYSEVYGDADDQDARGLAADLAGNAIVTGELQGTVDFGGGPLSSQGNLNDIFVAKLDPQGTHLWSYRFGDGAADRGDAVACGPDGSAFVTGRFEQTVTFIESAPLLGGNNEEVFVVKLAY